MGRKIPGKKHRGVKDPMEQRERRNESLKFMINAPPTNPNEQELPRSVRDLMKLRQMTRDGKFNVKKKPSTKKRTGLLNTAILMEQDRELPGMRRPVKKLPAVVQRPDESEASYMERVNRSTQEIVNELEFEEHFGVTVKRNAESGKVEKVEKTVPCYYEPLFKESKGQSKKEKRNKRVGIKGIGQTKKERQKARVLAKKSSAARETGADDGFEELRDSVKFGEVAHHPPTFLALPKRATKAKTVPRPGGKDLLLKSLFAVSKGDFEVGAKRQGLSIWDQRRREMQRMEAVAAYRQIKVERRKT